MAPKKEEVSFDAIIQRGRQQKKNEVLANQILGSGRRKSAPGAGLANNRKAPAAPSLASRMGVTKRSTSAAPKANGRNGAFGVPQNPSPRTPRGPAQLPRTQSAASRIERNSRLTQQMQAEPSNGSAGQRNVPTKGASGINIKGMGSGYTVIASNFAPGTTAADIEAVMAPIGGEMNYCKLTVSSPTVIAEMQFVNYDGAQNVITMFNNRKADGRLLYVYMKSGTGATSASASPAPPRPAASRDDEMMDVDDRGSDYRQPEPRPIRRAEPDYQDGRYGFRDTSGRDSYHWDDRRDRERRDRGGQDQGLYSDSVMRNNNNNNRGYRR